MPSTRANQRKRGSLKVLGETPLILLVHTCFNACKAILACHHLSEHPVVPEHSRLVCGKAQKASGKCRHKTSTWGSGKAAESSDRHHAATLPSFHCIKVICPSMPQVVPTAMHIDQMKNLITFHSVLPPPSVSALGLVSSIALGKKTSPK